MAVLILMSRDQLPFVTYEDRVVPFHDKFYPSAIHCGTCRTSRIRVGWGGAHPACKLLE